jgi:hypothetical protein
MTDAKINKLNNKIKTCNDIFNTVLSDLSKKIKLFMPNDPLISIWSGVIIDVIKNDPSKPINVFMMYIYTNDDFRINILLKNDKFFLDTSYSHLTDEEKQNSNIIMQIKSAWTVANDELKNFMKESLITLVKTCEQYINSLDDLNNLKK